MTSTEFENILSQIHDKLLMTARHFVERSDVAEEAEDIVQDALAELWELFQSGYPIRNVEALAVKVTKTLCVRHYRMSKIQTIPIDGLDFSGSSKASERIDWQENLKLRQSLFRQLSATQRMYLEMRNEREMSLDEIATVTGHPKASVKTSISQARKMMYEQLKKMQDE